MRRAFFLQCRSFSLSASNLYRRRGGPFAKQRLQERIVEKILRSVATQVISSQSAVQRITSLAKDKSENTRREICERLWEHSRKEAWKSKKATIAITDFLIHLSHQSQEDFDCQPKNSAPSPVTVEGEYGNKDRLWRDMPGLWPHIWNNYVYPSEDETGEFLNEAYFISLLFRSSEPAFDGFDRFLCKTFATAANRSYCLYDREDWKLWTAAVIVHMETAGARIKEEVLSSSPTYGDHFDVSDWLEWRLWQKELSSIAADEEISVELRAAAKHACDLMNIEKRLTNRWWRRWRKQLSEIIADGRYHSPYRIIAFRINNMLSAENAEEEDAAIVRLLPSPSSSLLLLPSP